MKKRRPAAGMAAAQRPFRRIVGCNQMPVLVAALRVHAGASRRAQGLRSASSWNNMGLPPRFNNKRDVLLTN